MATTKQMEANRRNAEKSTGPKSAEGKRTVSQNAVQHGLFAVNPVVIPEEQEEFDRFAELMRFEWGAQGARENFVMDRILDYGWRLKRVARIETGLLIRSYKKELQNPAKTAPASDADAYSEQLQQRNPGASALGDAYVRGAPYISMLSRHERAIERGYRAAMRELQVLQYARVLDCSPFYVSNMGKFSALDSKAKRKQEGRFQPNPTSDADKDLS